MFWAGLILTLLSTAAQQRQLKKANQRRIAEMQKGKEKQKGIEKEQRADTMAEAQKYDPAARQEALDAEASAAEERIKAVLSDNPDVNTGEAGVISDALAATRAQSVKKRAEDASILAELLSKVQAPGYAGMDEARSIKNLGGRTDWRGSEYDRAGRTAEALAQLEGMPSPEAMMLSGVGSAVGGSMMSGSIMDQLKSPAAAAAAPATGAMSTNPYYVTDWTKVV